MHLRAGTSGYSYAPWKGAFYPEKLPAAKMLSFYAGKLPTVEINNSFYRMPSRDLVARWAEEVPEEFRFVLKAPRRITHEKKLLDCEEPVVRFAEVSDALGTRRGPVLFQLPPFMRKDLPRLNDFLALMREKAPALKAAFEFRHPSWFDDETSAALRTGAAALCISESEDLSTPLVATTDWGYLRLRRQDYDAAAIAAWAERISSETSWRETYVFFKHEDEGKGPQLAAALLEKVGSSPTAATA